MARKQSERQAARRRIALHTQSPVTGAQLAFDPLARRSHRPARRRAAFWVAVLGSLAVHLGAVVLGFSLRSFRGYRSDRQEVKIEVRQKQPDLPPKAPEPPAPIEKPVARPPKIAKAPPPSAPPPPPAKAPPVRVVGLSLESTTEGGDGPAFAVGNTRFGETAKQAVDPKSVTAHPGLDPTAAEPRGPGRSNAAATRIPVAGVKIEMPKRRHPREPPYPATLKSQGIEDDVMVLIAIDATGKVTNVKILKPSQYPELNEAARTAAGAEEYEPATRDGIPIPYSLSFTYRFRLQEE